MKVNKHYIDKRFREELEGLEVNPPVEAWLAITEGLDKTTRMRPMPVFLRYAAAAAILAVASFSFWFFVFEQDDGDALMVLQTPAIFDEPVMPAEPVTPAVPSAITDRVSQHLDNVPVIVERETTGLPPGQPAVSLVAHADVVNMLKPKAPAGLQKSRQINFPADEIPTARIAYILPDESYPQPAVLSGPKATGTSGFTLGAHFAPQYSYRHLAANSSMYADIPFSSLESEILTYSAGLSVSYRLSPNWSIQAGVNYNNMGQFVKDIHAYHHVNNLPLYYQSQQIITSMGNIMINDPYHHFDDAKSSRVSTKQPVDNFDLKSMSKSGDGLTQIFRFAEIPIILRYQVYGGYIGLQLKGGFAANYLLQKDVYLGTDLMQAPIGKTHGIELFNLSAIGGFALNVPVTRGVTLHMEPTLQYFIRPFVQDGFSGGNVLPYGFSLQTGVSYSF